MNTDELLDAARRGDDRALDDLIRDVIIPTVRATCLSLVGSRTSARDVAVDADDIAQLAAIAAVRALRHFETRDGATFATYVRAIAGNKVTDTLRADGRHRSIPMDVPPELVDSAPQPDEAAVRAHEMEAAVREVDRLLSDLTPLGRDVLVLRLGHQLSAPEVAKKLRTTPGAVRVAQHRALAVVRKAAA